MRKHHVIIFVFLFQAGYLIYSMFKFPGYVPLSIQLAFLIISLIVIARLYWKLFKEQKIEQDLLDFQKDIAQKARAKRGEE